MTLAMTTDSIAHEIEELERRIFHAIQNKDAAALRPILGPDFVLRTPGNPDTGVELFLRMVSEISGEITSLAAEDIKVSVFGDIAVLTGTQRATVKTDDGEQSGVQIFTDVFQNRSGQWLLVLAHSADIAQ